MNRAIAAAALTLTWAAPALGDVDSENFSVAEQLAVCRQGSVAAQEICRSYIGGFSEGMQWAQPDDEMWHVVTSEGDFCLSNPLKDPPIAFDRLRHAFIAWAEAHPEAHHWYRADGILRSFIEAFPCE
jgi:hypothetical protein